MPLVSYLIDDKVPLIKYDDSWSPGTSGDTSADLYYLGTFTTCNVTGGTANWSFNGTAFWIYGAERGNHGTYSVTVDGVAHPNNNGFSANALFQQLLFTSSGLSQGMHNVSITNTAQGSLYIDIDLIIWQSEVGGSNDQLVTQIIQNTDPGFQYQEPAWNTNPPNVNYYSNGTGHSTTTYNASVTYTFTGDIVSLYGTVGPQNGFYSVQLDGGQTSVYNATSFMFYPQTMIYHADNLGPGTHQLVITNLPAQSGQYLNIDYAQVSTSQSNTVSPSVVNATGSSSSQIGAGPMAGIIVSVVVAVAALAAAVIFYRRWKTATSSMRYHDISMVDRSLVQQGQSTVPMNPNTFNAQIADPAPVTSTHDDYPLVEQTQQLTSQLNRTAHNPTLSEGTSITRSGASSLGDDLSTAASSQWPSLGRPLPTTPRPRTNDFDTPMSPTDPGRMGLLKRSPNVQGDGVIQDDLAPPNYLQATRS